MRRILIPGTGWDTESVVSGVIKLREPRLLDDAWETILQFPFDQIYPFTNIFWRGSPACYGVMVIGVAGSYKQIEEDWNEWLWKFSQLLSGMDALEAHVNLNCILGDYHWRLEPRTRFEHPDSRDSMKGQVWGITDTPEPDFTLDEDWLAHCASTSEWKHLVERWNSQLKDKRD